MRVPGVRAAALVTKCGPPAAPAFDATRRPAPCPRASPLSRSHAPLRRHRRPQLFVDDVGHHALLARRSAHGWARAERMASAEGSPGALDALLANSTIDVSQLVAQSASEHVLLVDSVGMAAAEAALLDAVQADAPTPPLLTWMTLKRALSLGGGRRSSEMGQVPEGLDRYNNVDGKAPSWLGLAAGAKLWHVAPPHARHRSPEGLGRYILRPWLDPLCTASIVSCFCFGEDPVSIVSA